jgi:L-alanine-DL-glutamate epimerase-like enolase superfamily enzyme
MSLAERSLCVESFHSREAWRIPERPGFGFTFDWDAVERYRL